MTLQRYAMVVCPGSAPYMERKDSGAFVFHHEAQIEIARLQALIPTATYCPNCGEQHANKTPETTDGDTQKDAERFRLLVSLWNGNSPEAFRRAAYDLVRRLGVDEKEGPGAIEAWRDFLDKLAEKVG